MLPSALPSCLIMRACVRSGHPSQSNDSVCRMEGASDLIWTGSTPNLAISRRKGNM